MLNHRRKNSDLFMNLIVAEEWQRHGAVALLALGSPCHVSAAQLLCFCGKGARDGIASRHDSTGCPTDPAIPRGAICHCVAGRRLCK